MNNTPRTVGSYEAKTHLPSLLAEAAAGREIVITKRDKPIAKIVPYSDPLPSKEEFFDRLREFHGRIKLKKGITTKQLIEEGRRI